MKKKVPKRRSFEALSLRTFKASIIADKRKKTNTKRVSKSEIMRLI